MNENEVSRVVVDACIQVHRELGPGLLENVYEQVLAEELRRRGAEVERQVSVPIVWRGKPLGEAYKADLIINNLVIVELKSVESIARVHKKQLLTYLRLADKRLGLLVNFGTELMKDGLFRVVNGL